MLVVQAHAEDVTLVTKSTKHHGPLALANPGVDDIWGSLVTSRGRVEGAGRTRGGGIEEREAGSWSSNQKRASFYSKIHTLNRDTELSRTRE